MKKSVLGSVKIKENFQKFDKIDFWCDRLTLSYTNYIDKLDNLLFWVDNDNSNFWTIEIDDHILTYNRLVTNNWMWLSFICEYNWVAVPLFQYVRFNKDTRILFWKSAKITIYWSYFRLENIWEFSLYSIINYIKTLSSEDPDITRYDFRIDYFSKDKYILVPEMEEVVWYIHSQSEKVSWHTWNKLVDWVIWKSDTWRYKIRYYDKKIDTEKKGKWFLYTDFLDYKSVHRLEFEFLRAFCRGFKLSNLSDLELKIYQVLNIDNQIYSSSLFYQYNSDSEITLDNVWRYVKRYINSSTKLLKAWYNPLFIIEEAMIDQYWEDFARWIIDDFISKSVVCKQFHNY